MQPNHDQHLYHIAELLCEQISRETANEYIVRPVRIIDFTTINTSQFEIDMIVIENMIAEYSIHVKGLYKSNQQVILLSHKRL
jgi:hypothetical protein